MKKKKLAMLLAAALTLTQVGAVPVAAEDLTMDADWEQEAVWDEGSADGTADAQASIQEESSADGTTEPEEGLIMEEDEEEILWETGTVYGTAEPDEDLIVEADTESIIQDDAEEALLELFSEEKITYVLNHEYVDSTGDDTMLPDSMMTISTSLDKYETDPEEEEPEPVESYQLKFPDEEGTVKTFGACTVSLKGTEIEIRSGSVPEEFEFKVEAWANNASVAERAISVSVSQYVILPEKLADTNGEPINPKVGDRVDILNDMKPQLYQYVAGETDLVLVSGMDYKIVIDSWEDGDGETVSDYDDSAWDWIGVENQELPILERTSGANTWFALSAVSQDESGAWNQLARRRYGFDALPGYDRDDGDGDGSDGDDGDIWHGNESEEQSDYALAMDFPDTIGNGAMLTSSQMTVRTELYNKKENNSQVTDYKLEIITQSNLGTATVSNDGKNLLIQSNDHRGSGCCYVSVQIPDGTGGYKEAFRRDIPFSVTNLLLMPQTFLDKTGNKLNPKEGESIDLSKMNIQLYEYREGTFCGIGDPNFKLTVNIGTDEETGEPYYDYDTNGWKMEAVSGQDLPIMTRITKNATWFAVTLINQTNGEQIARKIYEFDAVKEDPHTHTWKMGKITKEATCTSEGIRIDTCTCGETKKVTLSAKGHTEVKDAAVAATALKEGKTAGSHCSVCGTVLKKQNAVAKLTPAISLTASSLKMKTGQSTTAFKAAGFAAGDYVTKVTSGNTGIVKVTNVKKDGTFKLTAGKKTGSTEVTVSLASGKRVSFKVTVQKKAVKTTGITVTVKNLTLKKGETYKKLAASVTVAPVTSKEKITYSSSNKKVATVDSKGVIKAKKAGTAKITVKSGSKKVVVTVTVAPVKTTKLSGVPETKTIAKGKTFKIKAAAAPKNTDEKITYKSSNKKIVTVTSKGVVKGIRKGTATITVQSGSKKMTCKVTVK